MRIIIAPDSYKGSLSALAVAEAMERGVLAVWQDAEVLKIPIADGGEGTVAALVTATGGEMITQEVTGPLGDKVVAAWGILGDGETAVIEMAAASGLTLIPKERCNPLLTTTFGTGELIAAALDRQLRKLIIGIGGSATNDGGAGMAQALGVKFLDAAGAELPWGGKALAALAAVDLRRLDPRLRETSILVACDVDNPLCGPNGASAVYGPQKGATPDMIRQLDAALGHYAAITRAATGRDIAGCAGAGAAGGLGAGMLFFTNAQLKPGVEIVLAAAGFARLAATADLIITGEGNTDYQTAFGKAPVGVAKMAAQYPAPVVCLSGGLGSGHEAVLAQGVSGLMSIVPKPMPLAECINDAAGLVETAAARLCRLLDIGRRIGP
ncbi:MAG: glycerate kinase [Sporomusaceae bacterium]|nr:glycerate kinase [Sporomusaceae bacterium]